MPTRLLIAPPRAHQTPSPPPRFPTSQPPPLLSMSQKTCSGRCRSPPRKMRTSREGPGPLSCSSAQSRGCGWGRGAEGQSSVGAPIRRPQPVGCPCSPTKGRGHPAVSAPPPPQGIPLTRYPLFRYLGTPRAPHPRMQIPWYPPPYFRTQHPYVPSTPNHPGIWVSQSPPPKCPFPPHRTPFPSSRVSKVVSRGSSPRPQSCTL